MKIKKTALLIIMLCMTIGIPSCKKKSPEALEAEKDKECAELINEWKTNKNDDITHAVFTVTASEIRFAYTFWSMNISIPIYGGTEDPADFGDIDKHRYRNVADVINHLKFKNSENMKSKDFLNDILGFYKEKLEIKKPSVIDIKGDRATVRYNFSHSGLPQFMQLSFYLNNPESAKTVDDMDLKDNTEILCRFGNWPSINTKISSVKFDKNNALNIIKNLKKNHRVYSDYSTEEREYYFKQIFPEDSVVEFDSSCPLVYSGDGEGVAVFMYVNIGLEDNDDYNDLLNLCYNSNNFEGGGGYINIGFIYDKDIKADLTSEEVYKKYKDSTIDDKFTGKVLFRSFYNFRTGLILKLKKIE